MIYRLFVASLMLGGLFFTTGCQCGQGFFKGDLCAPYDPYGGGTVYTDCNTGCGPTKGCSSGGCGEKYRGDWISHPADRCEPCDRHGNYIGGRGSSVSYQQPRAHGGVVYR